MIERATCPRCVTYLVLKPSAVGASNPFSAPQNFCVCHVCAECFFLNIETGETRFFTRQEKEKLGQSQDIRKIWQEQSDIKREIMA